jgi:heat shock protein HslJ
MKRLITISIITLFLNCNTMNKNQEKKQISLENTTWIWQYTTQNSEKIESKNKGVFTITFNNDNINIGTDCNRMNASFTLNQNNFQLGGVVSTKMYCEDSQERIFAGMLSDSKIIEWNDKELQLKSDKTGTMFFVKK